MGAVFAFGVVMLLIAVGVPVAFAFAGMGLVLAWIYSIDISSLMTTGFWSVNSVILMALPFFIMTGYLMQASGMAARLVEFVDSLVGRLKGGHGAVLVVACGVLGAISGTATAAVASIGTVMISPLEERGYPRAYTSGLLGVSSLVSILIPPSITMILFAVVTRQSVAACFLSTVVPGILLMILLCIVNAVMSRNFINPRIESPKVLGSRINVIARSTVVAFPALLMPLIILGGIYGGVFTPTEAAAVTVIYAIPVGAFVYKGLSLGKLVESLAQAAETTGVIITILLFSFITGRIFTLEGIPQQLTEFMVEMFDNKLLMILFVNLLLIFLGIMLEDVILTVVVSPLLLPAMVNIGVHPVQFGAIVGTSVVIAANSPPTAPILYMACRIGNVRAVDAMRPALIFMIFAALPVQLMTSYWPPLSLYLPGLFGYLD